MNKKNKKYRDFDDKICKNLLILIKLSKNKMASPKIRDLNIDVSDLHNLTDLKIITYTFTLSTLLVSALYFIQ